MVPGTLSSQSSRPASNSLILVVAQNNSTRDCEHALRLKSGRAKLSRILSLRLTTELGILGQTPIGQTLMLSDWRVPVSFATRSLVVEHSSELALT